MKPPKHVWLRILIALALAICVWQFFVLHKAHSTLADYAAFRGCTSLSSQTATSAICTLSSGNTIELDKINNRWYLKGDGPRKW